MFILHQGKEKIFVTIKYHYLQTIPALAILILCCSIASSKAWCWFPILSNSSMQQQPKVRKGMDAICNNTMYLVCYHKHICCWYFWLIHEIVNGIVYLFQRIPKKKSEKLEEVPKDVLSLILRMHWVFSQSAIICSKLTIETLEQGVKYVQS